MKWEVQECPGTAPPAGFGLGHGAGGAAGRGRWTGPLHGGAGRPRGRWAGPQAAQKFRKVELCQLKSPSPPSTEQSAQHTTSRGGTRVMQQRAQRHDTGVSHHRVSPHDENEQGSRGEKQRGDSTEESFQQACTNRAADRPPDINKAGDTQKPISRVHQVQLAKIDDVERVNKVASQISKRFISKL